MSFSTRENSKLDLIMDSKKKRKKKKNLDHSEVLKYWTLDTYLLNQQTALYDVAI